MSAKRAVRWIPLLLVIGLLGAIGCTTRVQPLRVMSFNLRYGTAADGENAWDLRRELLLETIRSFDPDLLGTQECLQMQAEFLRGRLPGYGFVGVGRDDGRQGGEMCAVFFRADRFEVLAEGHFWLSEHPEEVASRSWDAALTRMVTWVHLLERATGRQLFFFNTHFDHVGQLARRESAGLLRRRARELAGDVPILITGDFNAPAAPHTDGPYRVLVAVPDSTEDEEAQEFLADTFRRIHPDVRDEEGTFNGFSGETSGERIDWILVSSPCEVLAAGIDRTQRDGRYPSDHFPVTAVVRLPTARSAANDRGR